MASTVTKKIEIQKKWIESLQAMYGPDVSISFIVDTLLEAYCDLTKDHHITIDKFKKEAVKNADTILRESSEI